MIAGDEIDENFPFICIILGAHSVTIIFSFNLFMCRNVSDKINVSLFQFQWCLYIVGYRGGVGGGPYCLDGNMCVHGVHVILVG